MTAKERLRTAWRFAEPDRVPIEMQLYPPARGLPGADEIVAFQESEASNVAGFVCRTLGSARITASIPFEAGKARCREKFLETAGIAAGHVVIAHRQGVRNKPVQSVHAGLRKAP